MRTMIHMNIHTRYTTLTDTASFYPRALLLRANVIIMFWARIKTPKAQPSTITIIDPHTKFEYVSIYWYRLISDKY
jgi:hypothetical protein